MKNQLTHGESKRIMYIENKEGLIDEFAAHIGWVTFSKSGKTVYYKDKVLNRLKGGGITGNHMDAASGDEYWVSGIKKRGLNTHWAEPTPVKIDDDAREEYERLIKR
ncbi:hypothetical protein NBRC116494_03900 [Aurantivibrio plasticivorans]